MKQNISMEELDNFSSAYDKEKNYSLLSHPIMKNGIYNSATDETLVNSIPFSFSIDVDSGNVCNQKRSGRCWMFAGLNVIRTILFDKLNVKNIELSQAYLQFFDKLEKANFYFEAALKYADEEYKSRNNLFILDSANCDGGHFIMFKNLAKKYGVVPSQFMPDSAVACDTTELNSVLNKYITQGIKDLREAKKEGKTSTEINSIKEKYLSDIYRILCMSIGKPVKSFKFEYTDKDNKFHSLKEMTPVEFYNEYIAEDFDEYMILCHAPLPHMEKYVKYTCDLVGNVVDGDKVVFFNIDLKDLKDAAINSLKDKHVLWFAADVSSQSLRKEGYLVNGVLKTNELFDIDYHMNKAERLTYRTSFCNHAMTLTGVNLTQDGTPNRWKVENSWGKENGKDGYYVMSDEWFDEYLYQIIVKKSYVSEEILDKWNKAEYKEEDPFDTLWAEMR